MFEVGTVVSRGFEGFKANVGGWVLSLLAYIGVIIVLQVINQIVVMVVAKMNSPILLLPVVLLFSLLGFVIGTVFLLGWCHMALKTARGETVAMGDVFSQTGKLVPGLICNLIVSLAMGIGMALLCVPGLIAWAFLGLAMMFVVDKELDPISAIKASIAATEGARGPMVVLAIVMFLLYLGGAIACGVGLLVTIPTIMIAWAHAYEALSAKAATV